MCLGFQTLRQMLYFGARIHAQVQTPSQTLHSASNRGSYTTCIAGALSMTTEQPAARHGALDHARSCILLLPRLKGPWANGLLHILREAILTWPRMLAQRSVWRARRFFSYSVVDVCCHAPQHHHQKDTRCTRSCSAHNTLMAFAAHNTPHRCRRPGPAAWGPCLHAGQGRRQKETSRGTHPAQR